MRECFTIESMEGFTCCQVWWDGISHCSSQAALHCSWKPHFIAAASRILLQLGGRTSLQLEAALYCSSEAAFDSN
jgi:hypothetical protein